MAAPLAGPDNALRVGYEALRAAAAAHVLARDVLRVSGPDAVSYLQGQCSQDVAALAVGSAADALLLSPQGKVDALVRVTRIGEEELVVDTEGGLGDAVEARLRRFRLRVKVDLDPLPWACVAVRGPEAGAVQAAVAVGAPVLRLAVSWPGLAGFDLLGPAPGSGADGWVPDTVVRCGDDAWEAARIEAGMPAAGREITDGTIAAEVGLVDRTVSFTKGCFTGQELVARIDSRGSNVARSLCGLVVHVPVAEAGAGGGTVGGPPVAVPPVGAVVAAVGDHRASGTVTSVAWSPGLGAPVALAVLHRRVTPPEAVSLRWESADGQHQVSAEARPLPLVG